MVPTNASGPLEVTSACAAAPKRMTAKHPAPDGRRMSWCRGVVPTRRSRSRRRNVSVDPRRPVEFHSGRCERRDCQQIASAAYCIGVCAELTKDVSTNQGRVDNFQQVIEFAWNAFGKLGSCHTRQPVSTA